MCLQCQWNHHPRCPAPPPVTFYPTAPPAWTPRVPMGAGSTVSGAAASSRYCLFPLCPLVTFLSPLSSSFYAPPSCSPPSLSSSSHISFPLAHSLLSSVPPSQTPQPLCLSISHSWSPLRFLSITVVSHPLNLPFLFSCSICLHWELLVVRNTALPSAAFVIGSWGCSVEQGILLLCGSLATQPVISEILHTSMTFDFLQLHHQQTGPQSICLSHSRGHRPSGDEFAHILKGKLSPSL